MGEKAAILIVDDNANLCSIMALILKSYDYTITTAGNGQEAVDKVREQPFDVILMDIKMPVMGGVESLQIIKEMRPEAVVVMMTAYAREDIVQEAMQKGAYDIYDKPVDIDKFIEVVESVTGKK